MANLLEYGFKGGIVQLQLHLLVDIAQYGLLLGPVYDLELLVQEQLLRILPQQPVAEPVVGTDQAYVIVLPDQPPDPFLHLTGGLVGKCHAEDIGGIDSVVLYQIGVAADQKLRLAAAGSRDHPHIPFRLQHRFPLPLIEILHEIRHTDPSLLLYLSSVLLDASPF